MGRQRVDLGGDGGAFPAEEIGDGVTQASLGDPMGAPGRHRQIAALDLVGSLGAGLDPLPRLRAVNAP